MAKVANVWDKNGSYSYWKAFQTMGIESVGRVTVWHMPWSDIKMQVKLYRAALKSEIKEEVSLRAQHLNMYIQVLKKYLVKGNESKPLFESPLKEVADDNGPSFVRVAPMLIEAAIEKAKEMMLVELKDVPHQLTASEEVTLRNLDRFATVEIRGGRMAQEMTIDAAKTAAAPKIFLDKLMKVMKLNVRRGEYDVKFDFDEKKDFVIKTEGTESIETVNASGAKVYHMADFFDELRRKAAIEGVQGWKELILDVKPEIPQEFLVRAQEIINKHKGLPEIVSVLMKINRTLENTRKSRIREFSGGDDAFRKAAEDTIRDEFRAAFDAITNTTRQALKGLTPEEAVLVVLAVTYETMGKDARRPATFVSTALEEEFTLFIASLCEEEPVAREKLVNAEFLEDGAEVCFVNGHQVGGKAFTDAALPDGYYTIQRGEHSVYATRKVTDVIRDKLAEEVPSQICFQSLRFTKKEDAEAFDRKIRGAKTVTLVVSDKNRALNANCEIHDAVIADGVIVGHFDNKVAPQVYLMSNQVLPSYVEPGAKAMVSKAVNGFFNYKQGEWSCSEINEIKGENGVVIGYNVFVALENVVNTFATNVKKQYPIITCLPGVSSEVKEGNRLESILNSQKKPNVGKSKRGFVAVSTAAPQVTAPIEKGDNVFGQFANMSSDF